ncbi:MAG: FAD-binding oxidoreductase [Candidatus Omnitrophica bacterium]|nr:FAD-binding oxidoreductase [Candidatus Omnitrophota bacterium]
MAEGNLQDYLKDASHFSGKAEKVFLPTSESEISDLLRRAGREGRSLTLSGAGTGLTGARVPLSGWILATDKLNRILRIDRDDARKRGRCILQPGVSLKVLEEALDREGLFYPPNPGESSAFLGGTVATNASGSRSFKYGPTRSFVRRLRIVLAGGEILDLARGAHRAEGRGFKLKLPSGTLLEIPLASYRIRGVKNAAGYYAEDGMDLLDLFIGSEGTLGVFTEIELEVLQAPEALLAGILFFESDRGAFRFAQEAVPLGPRALEFMDGRSLKLLSGKRLEIPPEAQAALYFEEECGKGEIPALKKKWVRHLDRAEGFLPEPRLSSEEKDLQSFREFRHDLPALINDQVARRGLRKVGTDFAVPEESAEEMFEATLKTLGGCGIDYVLFGHLGEHHLHANLLPKTSEEFERSKEIYAALAKEALRLKGTVSAEHGIGKARIPYLEWMVGQEGLREMARIKKALDPLGILSPGNIFPAELLKEV